MLDFTALEAEIARNDAIDASAKLLLELLFTEVEAHKDDPAALQALVDRGRAANDSLAAAIIANTPAAS
jgi:hypothetical protein